MDALILRHRATVGVTPPGILILHETHEPIMLGNTPLSLALLNNYRNGFKTILYDRASFRHKEYVVPPKNLKKFMEIGVSYFEFASMTLERVDYMLNNEQTIVVDDATYELKEV